MQDIVSSVLKKNQQFEKHITSDLLYRFTKSIAHFKDNDKRFYSI